MRKLTRNFLVLSRLTSLFSRLFITTRTAEYFLIILCFSVSLSLSVWAVYCLAGRGLPTVSTMMSVCLMCVVELSEIITRIILANIICSRKWWRSCNQPGESQPACRHHPHQARPGRARISRNNIVGVLTPASPCPAPAGTYVTFRGYITHL